MSTGFINQTKHVGNEFVVREFPLTAALGLIAILCKQSPFKLLPPPAPADGVGLNPLLQDPWMVIHPPVMFIGFASLSVPFSFAIAVLKDVPDIEGDKRFSIRTFTVRLGPERVFGIGLAALALAYAGMIVLGPLLLDVDAVVLIAGHVGAAALLVYWATSANPRDRESFTRFYMRVWALFFLEYLLVPIACLV